MSHEQIAFRMFLNTGCAQAYKNRHDAVWPELSSLLKAAGISDYSIFLDEENHVLFATLKRDIGHTMDELSSHPVMQRWWQYMGDLMRIHPDGSPVVEFLPCMFHLD